MYICYITNHIITFNYIPDRIAAMMKLTLLFCYHSIYAAIYIEVNFIHTKWSSLIHHQCSMLVKFRKIKNTRRKN